MANPQLEDGYTMLANELLEALAFIHLPPNEWQILLVVVRKTYGYKKKVDKIANFQIAKATGLGKEVVSRAVKSLATKQLITRNGKAIGLNKNYETWKLAELLTKVSSTTPAGEPINKKENIQKKEGDIKKVKTEGRSYVYTN